MAGFAGLSSVLRSAGSVLVLTLVLTLALTFYMSPARAATYTYTTSFAAGTDAFSGTITTDALGTLTSADVVDWNLVITANGITANVTGANSFQVSTLVNALTATAAGLFFDFGAPSEFFSILANSGCCGVALASVGFVPAAPLVSILLIPSGTANDGDFFSVPEENIEIARIASTPLPAALPLFAGGLGVLGFLARRRRRSAPLL